MKRLGLAASMLVFVVGVLFAGLNLHELAHTVAARLGGDLTAHYSLYHWGEGGGCVGCNWYDPSHLSLLGNLVVTVAGVLATQVVVLALVVWGAARRRGSLPRRLALVAAACLLLDFLLQFTQGLLAQVTAQRHLTRVDFADTLYLLHHQLSLGAGVLKAGMVVTAAVYAVLLVAVFRTRARGAPPAAAV